MTALARSVVAVVALAAVFTLALVWPRPTGAVEVSGTTGPYRLRLLVETPRVGARDVMVEVIGAPIDRLVVAPTMTGAGHAHATPPTTAVATVDGRYVAYGVEFSMAGRWEISLLAHGPGGRADLVLPIVIQP